MANILAVDDEKAVLALIKNVLNRDGHWVDMISGGSEIDTNKLNHYDLILLDVMMPGENGVQLCERIRGLADCPILFLTAKVLEEDAMQGFSVGADDYIMKPFRPGELRARINAHLRREKREKNNVLHIDQAVFYLDKKQLTINENTIYLTKSEYEICEFLARHKGNVFTKDKIYDCISDYQGESDSSAIVEHVKNIRAKLKMYGYMPIETVWGLGYKWR